MQRSRSLFLSTCGVTTAVLLFTLILAGDAHAQFGNSISGFIFGPDRRPIADANVELADEYSRMIGRVRTTANGRYNFNRLSEGRFRIRVIALGNYEVQESEVEIQNMRQRDAMGNIRISGYENVQRDIYLRVRKSNSSPQARPEVIFAQSVPDNARLKYESAIKMLDKDREAEGLAALRESIELFPEYYAALERLGTEYIRLRHFLPAELLFLKAIQVNPRGFTSHYGLAYAYNALGNTKESLDAVTTALEIDSRSVEATTLKGVVLRKLARFSEAESTLRRAKELSGGAIAEVRLHLGLVLGMDLKRYKDGVEELEAFLKLSPGSKDKDKIKKLIDELKAKADVK